MIIHFITEHFPPTNGGLEYWTYNHALRLSKYHKIYVYIIGDSKTKTAEGSLFQIDFINEDRAYLMAPLSSEPDSVSFTEHSRINFLLLRTLISRRISEFTGEKHILISNFLVGTGFISTLLSEHFDIPHIACVVGTDFSRGLYNIKELPIFERVANHANYLVAWSNEQLSILKKKFPTANIELIPTSIDSSIHNFFFRLKSNYSTIRLFSDVGYSFKKATQILLNSFEILKEEKIPLSLTICGRTATKEQEYWADLCKKYITKYPNDINFFGHLPQNEMWERMPSYDIYCSPTLGEGCSLSRLAAMCLGMPVVTTLCGEILDIPPCNHIRASEPGDRTGYVRVLRELSSDLLKGNLIIDWKIVKEINNYYSSDRELNQWLDLLVNFHNS